MITTTGGIIVDWDNLGKSCIRFRFVRHWTWATFETAVSRAKAMIEQSRIPVDIILDFEQSYPVPPDSIIRFASIYNRPQLVNNLGHVVTLTSTPTIRVNATLYNKLFQPEKGYRQTILAETLDQARHILREARTV